KTLQSNVNLFHLHPLQGEEPKIKQYRKSD
ncbi:hypothetical protein ACVWZB_004605, partial [Paenibacillus polymyxa]